MAALNEAWHTLSDPARRTVYDESLRPLVAPRSVVRDAPPDAEISLHGRPRRWPAAALMLIAAMAVIFVFTAYAVTAGSVSTGPAEDHALTVGTCVGIRPGSLAVEVPCLRPHYGSVHTIVQRGARCPVGTEGYFDRVSLDQVCIRVG